MIGGPTAGERRTVVAVVGCTRGLGRSLFEWFSAREAYNVVGCGTNEEELQSLRQSYPHSSANAVDIRDEAAVASWFGDVTSERSFVDLLICCAGVCPRPAELAHSDDADWTRSIEVNVLGTARTLRHAVSHLRTPGAVVVLVSSRYGRTVCQGQGCYSASKWATEAMAKTLALELQACGVVVVSLDPGVVNTDMLRAGAGAQGAAWCSKQQSPAEFANTVAPFICSLTMDDTGRNLTCPGSPAAYFQTGVAYKDRPAWASGFGAFVRARDETRSEQAEEEELGPGPATAKRPCTVAQDVQGSPAKRRRYFISGVMLGSRRELKDASIDLAPQDYRTRIAQVIRDVDREAEIVEPLDCVRAHMAAKGLSIEDLNKSDGLVKACFQEVVDLAKNCDVVVSNLPEASMGSAAEIWEAKKAGKKVLTISPLKDNWLLRSVTDHNFADLDDFQRTLAQHLA